MGTNNIKAASKVAGEVCGGFYMVRTRDLVNIISACACLLLAFAYARGRSVTTRPGREKTRTEAFPLADGEQLLTSVTARRLIVPNGVGGDPGEMFELTITVIRGKKIVEPARVVWRYCQTGLPGQSVPQKSQTSIQVDPKSKRTYIMLYDESSFAIYVVRPDDKPLITPTGFIDKEELKRLKDRPADLKPIHADPRAQRTFGYIQSASLRLEKGMLQVTLVHSPGIGPNFLTYSLHDHVWK